MTGITITETDVQKAVDFLRDNAPAYAKAKAQRIFLEEMRKSLKAMLILEAPSENPLGMKESFAYAHSRYQDHLQELRVAVEKEETERMLREGAHARIDVWRSWESSLRANKLP